MFLLIRSTLRTRKVVSMVPYVGISGWSLSQDEVGEGNDRVMLGINVTGDGNERHTLHIPLDKVDSVIERLRDAKARIEAGRAAGRIT